MTDANQNDLIAEIARNIVTQIAPQELPLFRATSEAYFRDPPNQLKSLELQDDTLGFGLDAAVTSLTPLILVALPEVMKFLWEVVKGIYKDDVQREIKRVFQKTSRGEPFPLSSDHINQVRQILEDTAKKLKLPKDKATLLVDAVIGQLNMADQ